MFTPGVTTWKSLPNLEHRSWPAWCQCYKTFFFHFVTGAADIIMLGCLFLGPIL
jgi:hypothetical protein